MKKKFASYGKCWEYLKESKVYFLIILLVFLISAVVGFIKPVFLVEFIEKFVKELIEKTEGMNFFQLLIFIFQNNLITAFIGMIFGLILGVFPLFTSVMNGYVLGFVSNKVVGVVGVGSLWKLIPHGIFEIPALIISLGLGLKLGMFIFAKDKKKQVLYDLGNSLRVFLLVILPLLIIAAIIETGLMFLLG